jgi:hypothetical protein
MEEISKYEIRDFLGVELDLSDGSAMRETESMYQKVCKYVI